MNICINKERLSSGFHSNQNILLGQRVIAPKQLGTFYHYDKRKNPIIFHGQRSKVKVLTPLIIETFKVG
jgi:hypothetical protein